MRVGNEWIEGVMLGFLCLCAAFDFKKREIPLILIFAGIVGGIGYNVWLLGSGMISVNEIGNSLLPGMFFVLISWGTKEKIGYGDGLLLFAVGLCTGFYQCFLGICIGLMFSAVSALLLLMMRKAKRESRIPFVPFLALGMGVGMIL